MDGGDTGSIGRVTSTSTVPRFAGTGNPKDLIYAQKPWLAHYRVPAELPIPSSGLIDAFEENARQSADSAALHYFEETISFRRLNDLADRFAPLLAKWGVGKGDRVALSLQNNPQFAIAQWGAWKRGAIVVPLNPMFKEQELDYHLRDSGARVWVCLDSLYDAEGRSATRHTAVEHVLTTNELDFIPRALHGAIPMLRNSNKLALTDTVDLVNALEGQAPDPGVRVPVGLEDVAYLVYTSGTTGSPKGAMNLHRSVAFNAEVYRSWMQIGPEDSVLGLAPLFHVTGLVAQLALSALAGIPLILFHRFDAKEAVRLARKWRATLSVAAITAYVALMNEPRAPEARGGFLPKCYSGGAPVPPSLTEQFEARWGTYIHNIYGLTESNSPTHAVPLGRRAPVDPASGALSIGVPIPNCEARIVDLEDPDREVPPGEAGELLVRGPMIFAGYWNKPEESARAFHRGYFRTGDVAIMDERGWFYLVDRKKDMIIASGFKVWPREVEDTLYQHPAVKEAAVIGVPDHYRGETVKAFVALKEGYAGRVQPAEIIQFCKDRMAAYKYPRQVEFVPEIPKTATGKFLRRQLRGQAQGTERSR